MVIASRFWKRKEHSREIGNPITGNFDSFTLEHTYFFGDFTPVFCPHKSADCAVACDHTVAGDYGCIGIVLHELANRAVCLGMQCLRERFVRRHTAGRDGFEELVGPFRQFSHISSIHVELCDLGYIR